MESSGTKSKNQLAILLVVAVVCCCCSSVLAAGIAFYVENKDKDEPRDKKQISTSAAAKSSTRVTQRALLTTTEPPTTITQPPTTTTQPPITTKPPVISWPYEIRENEAHYLGDPNFAANTLRKIVSPDNAQDPAAFCTDECNTDPECSHFFLIRPNAELSGRFKSRECLLMKGPHWPGSAPGISDVRCKNKCAYVPGATP